jgi:hypothetical protein
MSIVFNNTTKLSRVVSFSIYGDKDKYIVGLIDNLRLRPLYYPDFCSFIFFDNTVPKNVVETCQRYENVVLIDMSGEKIPKMLWRFLPKDFVEGVELFISRDCDSRLSKRESEAVYEWIKSKKNLHIMRDHPCHYRYAMYGGMFGLKNAKLKDKIIAWMHESIETNKYGSDCEFLSYKVYEEHLRNSDIMVHDTLNLYSSSTTSSFTFPFPSKMNKDFNFVGETIEINRVSREVDMLREFRDRI